MRPNILKGMLMLIQLQIHTSVQPLLNLIWSNVIIVDGYHVSPLIRLYCFILISQTIIKFNFNTHNNGHWKCLLSSISICRKCRWENLWVVSNVGIFWLDFICVFINSSSFHLRNKLHSTHTVFEWVRMRQECYLKWIDIRHRIDTCSVGAMSD